jgi:sensor domain CHASE-containing protein
MSQTFTDQRINLIHVYDAGGRLVWGKTFDLKTEREIPLDLSRELDPVSFQRLIHQQVPGKSTSGVIQTAYGAMIIASNPLLTSEGKGPSQGAMVMGRFFGAESLSLLAEQVDTSLKAWQADRDGLKGHEDLVVSYVSSNTVKLKEVSPEELRAYAVIRTSRETSHVYGWPSLPGRV